MLKISTKGYLDMQPFFNSKEHSPCSDFIIQGPAEVTPLSVDGRGHEGLIPDGQQCEHST